MNRGSDSDKSFGWFSGLRPVDHPAKGEKGYERI